MVDPQSVHAIPIFQPVSSIWQARLARDAVLERYLKGQRLFQQGERAKDVWAVLEGWIHLSRSGSGADGAPIVVFTVTPHDALCGISAMDSGKYNVSAMAGTACQALRIPASTLTEVLAHNPEFAYLTLRLCARRLQQIAEQYGAMAEPVADRIIRAILRLYRQFGQTLPVTHRELAQMAWTTTESAIRTVRRLKQAGYVTGSRGQLTLAQVPALEQLLGNDETFWAADGLQPAVHEPDVQPRDPHLQPAA